MQLLAKLLAKNGCHVRVEAYNYRLQFWTRKVCSQKCVATSQIRQIKDIVIKCRANQINLHGESFKKLQNVYVCENHFGLYML